MIQLVMKLNCSRISSRSDHFSVTTLCTFAFFFLGSIRGGHLNNAPAVRHNPRSSPPCSHNHVVAKDDPAFDYMWPKWREYPEDNFFFWQLKLQDWLYDKKTLFLVVVTDAGDPGPDGEGEALPGTIISYCIWERLGTSKEAKRIWAQKNTWQNMLDGT